MRHFARNNQWSNLRLLRACAQLSKSDHHRGQVHAMFAGTPVAPPQLDEYFLATTRPFDGGLYTLLGVVGADGGASDFGQRLGDLGGWPVTLPATWDPAAPLKNQDLFTTVTAVAGNQLTLAAPLVNDVTVGSLVAHDDTDAVQATIAAAEAAGGGVVQLGAHDYNIQRPVYGLWDDKEGFTTDIAKTPWWSGAGYLYLDHGVPGHIHFKGAGRAQTHVFGPPQNSGSTFFVFGTFGDGRVSDPKTYRIAPVDKGVTEVTLTDPADAAKFHPGDDVMLYGQSFGYEPGGTPVVDDAAGTEGPGGLNHFHEPNTVAGVSGNKLTLVYPTSKRFFADDNHDAFGIHNVRGVTYHDIEISDLWVSSQNFFFGAATVYGLTVDAITLEGAAAAPFGDNGGTPRRHMVIQNSTWTFGNGMNSYKVEEELDQLVDVQFLNNEIHGVAAPHTEGPSQGAALYGTEGACQFTYQNNDFYNLDVTFQDTTDDVIRGNRFHNAFLNLGVSYQIGGGRIDHSYLNYASQTSATVEDNQFDITTDFTPPWVLQVGHYDHATVRNNTLHVAQNGQLSVLITHGGEVTGNTIEIVGAASSTGIFIAPDLAPGSSAPAFHITGNTITGGTLVNGVVLADPGAPYAGHVCVENNMVAVGGSPQPPPQQANVTQTCP